MTMPSCPAFFQSLPDQPDCFWKACFCLPGQQLNERDRDEQWRLWLLLTDCRVLVFRLSSEQPSEALVNALAAALIDDIRGDILTPDLNALTSNSAGVLYGAPVSPIFCVAADRPVFGAALAFHARLDGALVALLASMAGQNTFWASARNYSRLVSHPRCQERRQALQRFPLLVAPVLLTHQRWPNLLDPKRFRWRAHDDAVVAAIDAGRDLTGALAQHYGISRGLVRSPYCAQGWTTTGGRSLIEFLQFLDAIPAHRRPTSSAEVEAYVHHLPAFWSLFGNSWRVAAVAFKAGYGVCWAQLLHRFDTLETPLNEVLIDASDYLHAVSAWLRQTYGRRLGQGRIAATWVTQRGLLSLIAASRRWHALVRVPKKGGRDGLADTVPVVLGELLEAEWTARELTGWQDMVAEGEAMQHCVADYWPDCVLRADRVFALSYCGLPNLPAAGVQRATALFTLKIEWSGPIYQLVQLRGESNVTADPPVQAFAARVELALNAPENLAARQLAKQVADNSGRETVRPAPTVQLDPESISVLKVLFDLAHSAVVFEAGAARPMPVAGYVHALDVKREALLAVGQPLALVREPDNPADPQAIRIEWQGQKLGYVPRSENASFAQQLDAGQVLVARICEFSPAAPPWTRLWFQVDLPMPVTG